MYLDFGAICGFHRFKHSFYLLQRGDPNPEIVKLEAIMRAMNEKYKAHSSTLVHKVFVPKSGTIVKKYWWLKWWFWSCVSIACAFIVWHHIKRYQVSDNVLCDICIEIKFLKKEWYRYWNYHNGTCIMSNIQSFPFSTLQIVWAVPSISSCENLWDTLDTFILASKRFHSFTVYQVN